MTNVYSSFFSEFQHGFIKISNTTDWDKIKSFSLASSKGA